MKKTTNLPKKRERVVLVVSVQTFFHVFFLREMVGSYVALGGIQLV